MRRLGLAVAVPAILSVGCLSDQVVQPAAPGAPMAVIMDGAHGGNPFFFFLPPLVPNPSSSFHAGTFNAGLSPVAEVCELTDDPAPTCVATVFGPAEMTLDQSNEHYHLNWDTKSSELFPDRFYRILVRGAPSGTVLGSADVDPVDQGMKNLRTGDVVPFQDGRTLPIKVRIEQQAFGTTNPDHVEQVVTNRIPAGTSDVTTNTGFAGARFSDDWLPRAAVEAGIDQVVVIIERIPVQTATPDTSCLESGLSELEGCYRFRTDPDLRDFGTFNVNVLAGVCVEIPEILHTGSPFQLHRRAEDAEGAPTGPTVALVSEEAPFLTCDTFTPTPPSISQAIRSGNLGELASASWHALVRGVGRLVQPRALHAVDFGAGGSTDAFSRFGWARAATLVKILPTDNQVAFTGTKVLLDPTVCLIKLHPTPRPLVSEPVTFTVATGGGTVGGGTSTVVLTGEDGCAHAGWILGPSTTPGGNTLRVTAAARGSAQTFTATTVISWLLDAGDFHSCVRNASGQASCWGNNGFAQLGDGTRTDRLVPTPVAGGLTFAALSPGLGHSCGLSPAGTAYCWGSNAQGQLGDGTTIDRLVPTPVAGGLTFAALDAGGLYTCGVTASGTYCWGSNVGGQLGDGTTTGRLVPTPVAGGLTFAVLSAGNLHTCGVTPSGTAYCWGDNRAGQLGDGTTTGRLVPTPVAGGQAFGALSEGLFHTCGVAASGVAHCWGENGFGQLGDGTIIERQVPTPVTGGLTFVAVRTGFNHSCGVTPAGPAYCWGFNTQGALGDGTTTGRLVPTPVAGGLTFGALSAAFGHTCGVTTSVAYCWGRNAEGQLGDGTTTTRLVPTAVAFATAPDIAIVGGTYNDRSGGLFGTAFLYDPTDPAGTINSVAIAGPAGWNGGTGLTIGRFQPPGMATTRSVWWVFAPAIATSGTYTATASIGGVVRRATFSIDATSTLEAPQITSVDPGTSQVVIAWTASPSAQSFLVRVNPVPFTGPVTAQTVVSGGTRVLTFTGLSLVAGGSYQAVVWAYDKDVMTPGAIGSQFNIGAQAVGFTAPSVSQD